MINWTMPLEACHEDGRIMDVELASTDLNPDSMGDYYTTGEFDGRRGIWNPDGKPWCNYTEGWKVRNKVNMESFVRKCDEVSMYEMLDNATAEDFQVLTEMLHGIMEHLEPNNPKKTFARILGIDMYEAKDYIRELEEEGFKLVKVDE